MPQYYTVAGALHVLAARCRPHPVLGTAFLASQRHLLLAGRLAIPRWRHRIKAGLSVEYSKKKAATFGYAVLAPRYRTDVPFFFCNAIMLIRSRWHGLAKTAPRFVTAATSEPSLVPFMVASAYRS